MRWKSMPEHSAKSSSGLMRRFVSFNENELHRMLCILCADVAYGGPVTAKEIHAAADQIETLRELNESVKGGEQNG